MKLENNTTRRDEFEFPETTWDENSRGIASVKLVGFSSIFVSILAPCFSGRFPADNRPENSRSANLH